ncbi:DUF4342 domain-containing protein [Pseudoroseicyclus sp. CXY001]|uniref:DUF4342 domain-containing protein n=1 Tax=Pseudoroseicyclus sp. CXY001 TaxID=3242492 RepID=UPI003570ECFC
MTDQNSETVTEEVEVSTDNLMDKVKAWAKDASVKRIRIKEPDGDIAVDLPLTFGALAGGALVLAAPALAIVGAVIGAFAKVKVEIVRDPNEPRET